jgi:hypothetical protein
MSERWQRLVIGVLLLVVQGCSERGPPPSEQSSFLTPELAGAALVSALEQNDMATLRKLLGPGTENLLSSGDDIADRNLRSIFVVRYRAHHTWVAGSPDDLVLQVGTDPWPLPIPLVRTNGRWRFDGAAGADEIVSRRIGANELHTIDVMRGFVDAQREYAVLGHDGPGAYARRVRSHPGKQDGLYWEPADGEAPSPAGPLLAAAAAEGYPSDGSERVPYHGYLFRLLLAQGPNADGGTRDYMDAGKLTGGFALIAWPVAYGESGIMTFIVNQDRHVWQRDLGSDTAHLVESIRLYDPDSLWIPVAHIE